MNEVIAWQCTTQTLKTHGVETLKFHVNNKCSSWVLCHNEIKDKNGFTSQRLGGFISMKGWSLQTPK